MEKIENLLEPISKVFNAILHPVETITALADIIIAYIPAVCIIIFLFYIVTGSKKILGAMFFTIMVFILLKSALVFNMTWLIIVLLSAILIIWLVGSII